MTKWRRFLLVSLAGVAILATATFYQSALIGWWRGEAKYKGRYTNSWHDELRAYEHSHVYSRYPPDSRWKFARPEPSWRVFIAERFPGLIRLKWDLNPPLQDGDPKAVAVLIALLDAPEPHVRSLAARGLESIGPPANEAVPALLRLTDDPEGMPSWSAWEALLAIDPELCQRLSTTPAPFKDWPLNTTPLQPTIRR
jgi:hypothetical protein